MKKYLLFLFAVLSFAYKVKAQATLPGLIINEISQGTGGTKEYMEFVVAGVRTCTDSTLDLRYWIFDDQNGWYGGAGTGIATGHKRFPNIANWQAVPYGSIILVYNDDPSNRNDKTLTLVDDPTDANHDHIYILPISSFYLEEYTASPQSPSSPTYQYPAAVSPGGYTQSATWGPIGLANSGDAAVVVNPSNHNSAYHSVGYGGIVNGGGGFQTPTIYVSGGVPGGSNCYLSNSGFNSSANYTVGAAGTADETPGAGNSAANIAWINSMLTQTVGGPTITSVNGYNASTCFGTDGSIVLKGLSPNTTYTINYTKNGVAQPPLTLTTNVAGIDSLLQLGAGTYSSITAANGPCASAPVGPVVITSPGIANPTSGSNSPVCVGQTLSLNAGTTSAGATYSWTGPNSFTSTSQNPTIGSATAAASGTYKVVINVSGCTDTLLVAVTVSAALPAPAVGSNSPVCLGDTIKLNANSSISGASYVWNGPAGFTSNSQNPTRPNATAAMAGSYTVYATAGGCQSLIDTIIVTVNTAIPAPPIYADSFACAGATLQLGTDSVTGAMYTWIIPNGTYAFAQNPAITNMDLTKAGTYGLYITVNGCKSPTTTKVILVRPSPAAPVTRDTAYCQNAISVPLSATGSNLLYYNVPTGGTPYSTPPTPRTDSVAQFIYYATQKQNGCEGPRAPIKVTINPVPNVGIYVAENPGFCQHDTLTAYFTGQYNSGNSFAWSIPTGAAIIGGSLSSPSPLSLRLDSAGSQHITVTLSNGLCSAKALALVQVYAKPNASLHVVQDACYGELVGIGLDNRYYVDNYTTTYPGASLVRYDPNIDVYYVRWNVIGTYTVTATLNNPQCPSTILTKDVTVHFLPNSKIVNPSGSLCINTEIQLSADNNTPGFQYNWLPEPQFSPNGKNQGATVTALLNQHNVFYLYTTDNFNCTSVDSITVTGQACCTVFFPNAFTPNNDGKNDRFRPITDGNHNLNIFLIENRWGEILYETRKEHEGWDGRFKGVDQPVGTYFYMLKFLCNNGETITKKGSFQLIR